MNSIESKLSKQDDTSLWHCVLDELALETKYLSEDGTYKHPIYLTLGCCSHWLRPHQTRWTAAGGFAWPSGYGDEDSSFSRNGLPNLDWEIVLLWDDEKWCDVSRISGKNKLMLRVAVPARTMIHDQAAIHTCWNPGTPNSPREKITKFYGFRKKNSEWKCVASNDI
ncbi:MAG: hypothetical protein MJH11_13245 [Lentisphaeria bacterium]|nr:hypothetical protein [Lentisphaeria bacterium]